MKRFQQRGTKTTPNLGTSLLCNGQYLAGPGSNPYWGSRRGGDPVVHSSFKVGRQVNSQGSMGKGLSVLFVCLLLHYGHQVRLSQGTLWSAIAHHEANKCPWWRFLVSAFMLPLETHFLFTWTSCLKFGLIGGLQDSIGVASSHSAVTEKSHHVTMRFDRVFSTSLPQHASHSAASTLRCHAGFVSG